MSVSRAALQTHGFSPRTSRLSTWLTEKVSENFSAAYIPTWVAGGCVASLMESFFPRRHFFPEVPAPLSICAALAVRLVDTKLVDEAAVHFTSLDAHTEIRQSYVSWAGK